VALIAVIDDEPGIRLLLRLALEGEGHTVVVHADGLKALKWLEKHPRPDLIIADLSMPVMGGREMILILRSREDWQDIPVVIMTGSIPHPNVLPPAGSYNTIIEKPFDLEEVFHTVNTLVKDMYPANSA
jgi:CheY-like chemotaxis protein